MTAQEESSAAGPDRRFAAGPADIVIWPLVVLALLLRKLARALVDLLIRLLDYAFPILLQVMRFPLFTLRIVGDGVIALTRAVVSLLPVGSGKKAAWREAIAQWWRWVRQKISYKAFEEAVHHAFEGGMAWVFRKCKALTPGRALLVLVGAFLWFPISFTLATGLHAILFAKAISWPAWTQLLHPVATIVAKTKLLVLPVFPAAWPQAKAHPMVQSAIRLWRGFIALAVVQKVGHRYRQADYGWDRAAEAMGRTAIRTGLHDVWVAFTSALNAAADWFGLRVRALFARIASALEKTPGIGHAIAAYAARYETANAHPHEPLSDKVGDFFARWSVKFTAAYYEEKERKEAEKRAAQG